eukprot:GHVS01020714.1.p1 GENE.GHVS01020714.1~~GHVS01020714.1.p1  ORF type:complete len:776 (+),score=91.88 GHVS01020714.1:287-2614(+)
MQEPLLLCDQVEFISSTVDLNNNDELLLSTTPSRSCSARVVSSPEHIRYPMRWPILFVFSILALLNNVICFTLSPVSHFSRLFFINATPACLPNATDSLLLSSPPPCGDRFHIYNLIQVFFISYSLLSFISPSVCHSIGLRLAVVSAAWIQAFGCLMRWLPVYLYGSGESKIDGGSMFMWALIGQAISGISQAFFVNTVSQFSCVWFGDDERVFSTSVALNANTLGIAVIYATAPFLVHSPSDIGALLWWVSASAIASALVATVCFRDQPPTPPSKAAHVRRGGDGGGHSSAIWRTGDVSPNTNVSSLVRTAGIDEQILANVTPEQSECEEADNFVEGGGDKLAHFRKDRIDSLRWTNKKRSGGDGFGTIATSASVNYSEQGNGQQSIRGVQFAADICSSDSNQTPTTPTDHQQHIPNNNNSADHSQQRQIATARRGTRRWTVGFTIERPPPLVFTTEQQQASEDSLSDTASVTVGNNEQYADTCLTRDDLNRAESAREQQTQLYSLARRSLSCLVGTPSYVASGCCWGWESIWETLQEVVRLFGKTGFSQLVLAFSLSEAVINCYSTEMSSVMDRQHIGLDPKMIAIMGSGFILTCVIGSSIIGPIVDVTRWYKSSIMLMLFLATLTAVAMCFSKTSHFLIASILILGLWIGPVQPVCIEAAVDVTFPLSENLAVGIMQLTGNCFSMALLPWFTYLGTTSYLMGRDLAVSLIVAMFICSTFRGTFRRWRLEQNLPVSARSRAPSLIFGRRVSFSGGETEPRPAPPRVHGLLVGE